MIQFEKFRDRGELLWYLAHPAGGVEPVTGKAAEKWMYRNIPAESHYQGKIIRWLRKNYPDAVVWKAAAGPYSRCGIPDIAVVYRGRYIGMEVKRPFIGKPTQLQEQTIRNLRKAGAVAGIVSFERDAAELMQEAGG